MPKLKEIENYVTKKYGKPKGNLNGMALDTILRILKPYPNKLLRFIYISLGNWFIPCYQFINIFSNRINDHRI